MSMMAPADQNTAQEDQPTGLPEDPQQPGPKLIRERLAKGQKALRAQQHQFWLNHAFLHGEQWLWFNPQTRSLDQLPRDPDRVQMTVNKMWPASRNLIAKLVSRPLVFDVPPSGADDATVRAARTAESILNSLVVEHKWETIREEAAWGAWKGGVSAICVEWDSSLGDPITLPDGQQINIGDTVETALTIVDFVVEPGVRDAEKARWWIKALALPPEQVQAMYNLPKAPAADASAASTPFQAKLQSLHTKMGEEAPELTQVLTYYERPNPLNPQGSMIVVVGEEVVEGGSWPFPFKDKLNLAVGVETVIGGKWTGDTVLRMGRSIQCGINQSWSSIVEHMKQCGNARLFVPQSAVDMIDEMTDLPGEIVPYPDGTTPPAWESPPQMPGWWLQQPAALAQEMDEVLGLHDVSRGQAPANIESGLGLSILIEQDQTPIGRMTKEFAGVWGRVAQLVLDIYQENVLETRQSVIKTPGQPAETTDWTGGSLMGQTAAVVPLDAVMPRSRAQQLEFAKQAMQMGLIGTLEQFVKVADLPDQRDLLEALSPDVAKARRENHKMALGSPEPPAVFDMHAVHIQEHLNFMKGPRWDNLTPQAQQIFVLHNQAHEVIDAENMARMLSKAQISPVLASAADKNGTLPLPMQPGDMPMGAPPAGGPMKAPDNPAPAANAPTPATTDPGKKVGNAIATAKGAGHKFNPVAP